MTSKTISLKMEAYKRLKGIKENEKEKSFSDVVMELTKRSEKDFSDLIGKDIGVGWKEVKKARKRRKEDEEREELLLRH